MTGDSVFLYLTILTQIEILGLVSMQYIRPYYNDTKQSEYKGCRLKQVYLFIAKHRRKGILV